LNSKIFLIIAKRSSSKDNQIIESLLKNDIAEWGEATRALFLEVFGFHLFVLLRFYRTANYWILGIAVSVAYFNCETTTQAK
jgi:hypothetical protein